jgi:histidyl-tRNA synthetase
VIVIGDDELKSGTITIKELATGEEVAVQKNEVVKFFATDQESQ